MIHASNFEFDGICANDMGYYIVSFDGDSSGEQDYGDVIVYNTSKAANQPHIHIHGSHTEEPKKFSFQIMKFHCNGVQTEPISPAEQAFLKKWLEKKDGYRYLRFPEKGYADIFYLCTINVKWMKVGSQIYGATLYITCDSVNGYSDIQTFEIQNFQSGDSIQIYNDSDDVGLTEMIQIEITARDKGSIHIINNMDSLYYCRDDGMDIANCVENETLVINGITKEITSVRHNSEQPKHPNLADDYNYNPLHLIHLDDSMAGHRPEDLGKDMQHRINTIENQGAACDLSFAYRTIRTGVI